MSKGKALNKASRGLGHAGGPAASAVRAAGDRASSGGTTSGASVGAAPAPAAPGRRFLRIAAWDWACAGILLLVTLAMFGKGLVDPVSIVHEDAAYQFQPFYHFVAEEMTAGRIPHWCPDVSCGVPFHSTLHGAVLYPLHWPVMWMDYSAGYMASLITHYFLTALFLYLFLRVSLRCSPPACLIGAMSFAFGGFTFGHVTHWNYFQAYPWFILAIFFFSRALEKNSWRWAVWAGVPVALIGLVGAVHILLILGLGLGLWAGTATAIRVIGRLRARQGLSADAFLPVAAVAIALALGAVLAAPQLWPGQLQSELSTRAGGTMTDEQRWAFITEMCAHPVRTAERMVVPFLYGNYHLGYWGENNYHEATFYAGIIPLAAGVLAIGLCWRNPWVKRLAVLGLVMLVLAAGRFLPVFEILYRLVPGFDRLRNPVRIYVWVQFCIAALAAIGIDRALDAAKGELSRRARTAALVVGGVIVVAMAGAMLAISVANRPGSWGREQIAEMGRIDTPGRQQRVKTLPEMRRKVIDEMDPLTWAGVGVAVASAGAFAAFFAVKRLRRRGPAIALAALAAIDLGIASTGMLHFSDHLRVVRGTPDHVRFLQENLGDQRYVSWRGQEDAASWYRGMQFDIANAFSSEPGIFHNPRQRVMYTGLQGYPRVRKLAGVKYIVTDRDRPIPEPNLRVAYESGGVVVLEDDQALPPAFLARRVLVRKELEQVARAIADPATGVDLRDTAILEEDAAPLDSPGPLGKVSGFSSPRPGLYRMRTDGNSDGQLVLTVTDHPEWVCTIDGKDAAIHLTDFAFMSVRVPAGQHEVVWQFVPRRYYQGLGAMVVGVVMAVGALVVVPLVRRRKAPKADP